MLFSLQIRLIAFTVHCHQIFEHSKTQSKIESDIVGHISGSNYSPLPFNERVNFGLQHIWSLSCACVFAAFSARRLAYNHFAIIKAYRAANTNAEGNERA